MEALLQHPELQAFVAWVKTKPADVFVRTHKSTRVRKRRRMSALLLDTHVWLWYAEGVTERLRPTSTTKLDDARKGNALIVSAISVWEIGMHAARGRIQLAVPLRDWVERALAAPGIRLAPLDAAVAAESTLLPGQPQGDRADRFLIATARNHGVVLATRDERILDYAKSGFVRVVRMSNRRAAFSVSRGGDGVELGSRLAG